MDMACRPHPPPSLNCVCHRSSTVLADRPAHRTAWDDVSWAFPSREARGPKAQPETKSALESGAGRTVKRLSATCIIVSALPNMSMAATRWDGGSAPSSDDGQAMGHSPSHRYGGCDGAATAAAAGCAH